MSDILFNPPQLSAKRHLRRIRAKGEYRFPFLLDRAVVNREGGVTILSKGLLFSPETNLQYVVPLGAKPFFGYDCITVTAENNIVVVGSDVKEIVGKNYSQAAKICEEGPLWGLGGEGQLFFADRELTRDKVLDQEACGLFYASSYSSIAIVYDSRENAEVRQAWREKGLPEFDYTLSFAQSESGNFTANGFLPKGLDPRGFERENVALGPMQRLFLSTREGIWSHDLRATAGWEMFLPQASSLFSATQKNFFVVVDDAAYIFDDKLKRKAYFSLPKNLRPKGVFLNRHGALLFGSLLQNDVWREDIIYLLDFSS